MAKGQEIACRLSDEVEYSIVLPIYNERQNLRILISSLREVMSNVGKKYEIICVNDGSTDGSEEILSKLQEECGEMNIVNFERNYGLTSALACGFSLARGDIVITMDSDLQNDPQDIPKLLEKIRDYDVVCGVRACRYDSWMRIISSRIANYVRNKVTGDNIRDVGCTLRAYRKEFLLRLKLFDGMHRFLPTLLKWEGAKVVEVEVSHHPRIYGKAKFGVWNRIFKGLIDLLAVLWMKKRRLNYKIKSKVWTFG